MPSLSNKKLSIVDGELRHRLKVLAERYPRYGYLTLHEMLKQEGRVNPPT